MNKRVLFWLLVFFVLLDLIYSYAQNYQLPLDGDMAEIILPAPSCLKVMQDPFGWASLMRDEVYVAPNRFFAHASMMLYFKSVPFWLQKLTDPVNSLYVACALFKTVVQGLLLYLLGVYISNTYSLRRLELWVAVALLVPLFQTSGFNVQMGVIDHSTTYTFFYAFSMTLLLVLLLPFYQAAYRQQPLRLHWLQQAALVGLMVVLAFNAPIVIGTTGVLIIGIGGHLLIKYWSTGSEATKLQVKQLRPVLLLLGVFAVLCVYSLYIGRNDAENLTHTLPVLERYKVLPYGLFRQLAVKPGLPLLLLLIGVNVYLIQRKAPATPESRRLVRIARWVGLFAVVYIVLLPLGGYRNYRPLILRRDSFLPVTLGLFYFYGLSSYYLLQQLPARPRRFYLAGLLLFCALFLGVDRLKIKADNNACERQALERLAGASEPIVRLDAGCNVMSWQPITQPVFSEVNAQLLEYWGVTQGKKLYYQ